MDDDMTQYLSPDQVCALIPGMTKGNLAQLRHAGGGPVYMRPSPRVIVYARTDIDAWLEQTRHARTDQPITTTRAA